MNIAKKFLFSWILVLSVLHSLVSVHATNWSDIKVASQFTAETNTLNVYASLSQDITPNQKYYLVLVIAGEKYGKEFVYNTTTSYFNTWFSLEIMDGVNAYPYTWEIYNSQAVKIYSFKGVFDISQETLSLSISDIATLSPVVGTVNSSNESTSITRSNTMQEYFDAIVKNIPISAITDAEKRQYFTTILSNLERYSESLKDTTNTTIVANLKGKIEEQIQSYNWVTEAEKKQTVDTLWSSMIDIQRYNKRSLEPKIINGIGNNPYYSSWRVEN